MHAKDLYIITHMSQMCILYIYTHTIDHRSMSTYIFFCALLPVLLCFARARCETQLESKICSAPGHFADEARMRNLSGAALHGTVLESSGSTLMSAL